MPRLCKLTDSVYGNPVFINPQTVTHVDSYSPETVTIIHFDKDHTVGVNEKIEVVVRALEDAHRA